MGCCCSHSKIVEEISHKKTSVFITSRPSRNMIHPLVLVKMRNSLNKDAVMQFDKLIRKFNHVQFATMCD